jgi:hypothetical protein
LDNPVSIKLFAAFASACRNRALSRSGTPLRAAAE